jgi:hypothetical protein
MPYTVKSFDNTCGSFQWSLEAEKVECNDSSGKANLQVIIHGYLNIENSPVDIDTQYWTVNLHMVQE